mmetsp:Transcript_84730/g.218381  ORF Transcript_84730/g.218381 Transcript_84730/m.218381 type:complete len:305 (+) Transcript_84730:75-989(+)
MPCPACGQDHEATGWKADPLRWDLDPPCSEVEWQYLADMAQAPEVMSTQKCGYLSNICRGCYSVRLEIKTRVLNRIREKGGMEQIAPSMRMRKDYEKAHASDIVIGRAAKIEGLQSAAGSALNGQYCKLLSKEAETDRWLVEMVSGEQKSIKEANIMVSLDIDTEYLTAKVFHMHLQATTPGKSDARKEKKSEERPLGQKTPWPKVKGVHPGAVVRLHSLTSASHLNGRLARCLTFDNETGRWKVDLGDEHKSLKPDNFTPAPGEKPPTRESAEAEKKEQLANSDRRGNMSAKQVFAEDYGWGS